MTLDGGFSFARVIEDHLELMMAINELSETVVALDDELAKRCDKARVEKLERVAEAARKASEEYEMWRTDASDGEFALWSEDRLVLALHNLRPALVRLDEENA